MYELITAVALAGGDGPLNLGQPNDWSLAIGLGMSAFGMIAAVWKLARAATRLEHAVDALAKHQEKQDQKGLEQWTMFTGFQNTTTTALNDLRLEVNKLTWERDAQRNKGKAGE